MIRTSQILRALRFGVVVIFSLSSCAPLSKIRDDNYFEEEGVVSLELQRELSAMQDAVMPPRPGMEPEQQIANLEKYTAPQAVAIIDGLVYSREEMIEVIRSRRARVRKAELHDRQFIASGDTIFVQGLMDKVMTFDGKETEFQDAYFCDVFTRVDGRWLILATVRITHPMSAPSTTQNSR